MSFDELIDRHRGVGHGLYFVRITQKGIPGIPFFFFCRFRFYPWLLFVFYTIGTIHCELYFFYIFLEKRIKFITL